MTRGRLGQRVVRALGCSELDLLVLGPGLAELKMLSVKDEELGLSLETKLINQNDSQTKMYESDKKDVLGLGSCQGKLEAKTHQMEEVPFLMKAEIRTRALRRSEACWEKVENPIEDNVETRADKVLTKNGLAPESHPSHLMVKFVIQSFKPTIMVNGWHIEVRGLSEEGILPLISSMLIPERASMDQKGLQAQVRASLAANTVAISGYAENKQITEMLPGIFNQLGAKNLMHTERLASNVIRGGIGGLGTNVLGRVVHRHIDDGKTKGTYGFCGLPEMDLSQDDLARVCKSRSCQKKGFEPKGRRKQGKKRQDVENDNLVQYHSSDT